MTSRIKLVVMPDYAAAYPGLVSALEHALPGYAISAPATDDAIERELREAEVVFGWVAPDQLSSAHRLRWLHSPHVAPPHGYFYPALVEHRAVVTNTRGAFNEHIAQHVLMYVLALARGLPAYFDAQRARRWDREARQSRYIDLNTASVLVFGVGGIGLETSRLLHGLGARVLGIDARWQVPDWASDVLEPHQMAELDTLLGTVDFVIVTVPHTDATAGMWNADRFARMKPTAYFINIGRGGTTRLDDLADAVAKGIIAGCALDVFEQEPLPEKHPLWTLGNVILTPHVAAAGAEGEIRQRKVDMFIDNARRFAAGETLISLVNKAAGF